VWWELVMTRTMIAWSQAHCGLTGALAARIRAWEPEARARGDHFMVTNLLAFPMPIERILAGEPDAAEAHLVEAMALWPYRGFHIQHVSVLFSRGLKALFLGDGRGACDAVSAQWPAMVRSLQTQNQQTRVMLRDVRARGAVAAATAGIDRKRHLRRAERDLRALERERSPWTDGFAARLRGALCAARGDDAGAVTAYRAAIPALETSGLTLQAAAVQRRLGQALGGDDGKRLVSGAESLMRERSVADVEGVTRMYG
jgi:hypothetical protein